MSLRRRLLLIFGVLILVQLLFQPINVTFLVGSSMEPTISDGDIVVTSQYVTPKEGDIVRFNSEQDRYDYPVIHRVVHIGETTVQTKGDNNSYRDNPIPKEDVTGTVIFILDIPRKYQFYHPLLPEGYDELEERHDCTGVKCWF